MPGKKNNKRSRNFMYSQQVSRLPNNMSVDEVYDHVVQKLKPKQMACILHDKDLKDDNKTPAEDHIHLMMQFDNARSVNQIAKELGEKPQQVEIWNSRPENGYAYLIHATDNSRHKHQYSCSEVRANFDFPEYIRKVSNRVEKSESMKSTKKITGMLDMIAAGELSLKDAKGQVTGSQYAQYGDKFKKAHELFLDRSSEKMHEEMVKNDEMLSVHWFFGESETGKTFLAEKLARQEFGSYYKTVTTRDPFQFYQAEHCIILDELRPDSIPYSELLALLDPFSRGKIAVSSRYFNKALSVKTIFITTPYDPAIFYYEYGTGIYDRGEQLFRRLSSVIKFDLDYIYLMEFDSNSRAYTIKDKKDNPYSKKNQKPYHLENIFDRI